MTDRTDLGLTDTTAGCSCCAPATSTASALPDTDTSVAVTKDVLVTGMTCAHCVFSVTEELTGIDGVHSVSVDLHPGGASRVTILSTGELSADDVRSAVEEAGYALSHTRV